MTDALDAELETEALVAAVQDAADRLSARGFLPGALVLLASPRTVREQRLVQRVGHLLPVREANVEPGDRMILPANEADEFGRGRQGPN